MNKLEIVKEMLNDAREEFYSYIHEPENKEYRKGYAAGRLHSLIELEALLVKEEKKPIKFKKKSIERKCLLDSDQSIEIFNFSPRTLRCLQAENILTINGLLNKSRQDLLRIPNFGKKSLNEINLALEEYNLYLDKN